MVSAVDLLTPFTNVTPVLVMGVQCFRRRIEDMLRWGRLMGPWGRGAILGFSRDKYIYLNLP